mmetsp:Transcript_12866/g.12854  ORF Transcript_12866/g.12854 Transcript_12866/m.12854 type:complete len:95 (-) Transcript_12866:278-562(-)
MKGIFEGVTAAILYCGLSSHNFCMILMYNIMLFFNCVQLFAELGTFIQDKAASKYYDSKMNSHHYSDTFFVPYLVVLFIFYLFAIITSFLFYRE